VHNEVNVSYVSMLCSSVFRLLMYVHKAFDLQLVFRRRSFFLVVSVSVVQCIMALLTLQSLCAKPDILLSLFCVHSQWLTEYFTNIWYTTVTNVCRIYCRFTSPIKYLNFLQFLWSVVKSRSETHAVWQTCSYWRCLVQGAL